MTRSKTPEKTALIFNQNTIQMLEDLPIGVFLRRNGKIVFMNGFLRGIIGYGNNSLIQVSPAVPEDQNSAPGLRPEMLPDQRRSTLYCLNANGEELHIAAQGIAIESPDGPGVLYFLEDTPSDISKKKAPGTEARLLDMVSDGLICMDLELKITSWYRGAESIFGYSRSEVIGKHLSMLYERGKDKSCPPQDNEFHEKGEGFLFETLCLTRDGRRIWATFSISIIHDDNGRPRGFVATVQDITRRRQEQEALKQSEERYRTLVNAIPDYLYIVQVKGNHVQTIFHGPQCQRITGYTPDDYFRDTDLWFRMVHPEDRHRVQAFANALNEGNEASPIEHRIRHRDGSIRWVRHNALSTIISNSPKEILIHGIVSEIPDHDHQGHKDEVRGAIHPINVKIGAACRELELPIQKILGRTELLLGSISQDDPQYQLISIIADQALQMAEINRKVFDILGDRTMIVANEKRIIELKTTRQQHPDSPDYKGEPADL